MPTADSSSPPRAGASEVVGFDVDDRLIRIAQAYVPACGAPARIECADVMDEAFMRQLGTFDLITCNDVIEHVDDVPVCIAHLAGALNPGGVLYLAIPNRRCPQLIRSDPHFHVFGIVLLSRPEAITYHTLITGVERHDVGDYFGFHHYADLLRGHGLHVTTTNTPQVPTPLRALKRRLRRFAARLLGRQGPQGSAWWASELEADIANLRRENEAFDDPRRPDDLKTRVRQATSDVIDVFETEMFAHRSLLASGEGAAAHAKLRQIGRDFYLPTWYVLAQRKA